MVRIVATIDQVKKLLEAQESVEIVDGNGKRLGFFARPFTDVDVRIALERLASNEERLTTKSVLVNLLSLDKE